MHRCIFDFCALINVAYQRGLSPQNTRAGFARAGIWPIDPSKLLGQPRPATSEINAPFLSVEELMVCMEARRVGLRTQNLGENATITASGFIDTQKGFVVTSARALELAELKSDGDHKKREKLESEHLERELKEARRANKQLVQNKRFNESRDQRRVDLCSKTLTPYRSHFRPLKERRHRAKQMMLQLRSIMSWFNVKSDAAEQHLLMISCLFQYIKIHYF